MLELAILIFVFLCVCSAALIATASQQEWVGSWHGHQLVVKNFLSREELYIDGALVSKERSMLSLASRLTSAINDGGREVPVLVTVHPSGPAYLRIDAQLFVDGESIALQRVPLGTFVQDSTLDRDATPAVAAEPQDSRWGAVQMLLSDMRSRSSDLEPIIGQAESQLRELLNTISTLTDQLEAHRELDIASGETGAAGLLAIRSEREEQARALIAAIQQLHLSVLQEQKLDHSDALVDLRSRLEIELELRSDEPLARAHRAAAAAQKQG